MDAILEYFFNSEKKSSITIALELRFGSIKVLNVAAAAAALNGFPPNALQIR